MTKVVMCIYKSAKKPMNLHRDRETETQREGKSGESEEPHARPAGKEVPTASPLSLLNTLVFAGKEPTF